MSETDDFPPKERLDSDLLRTFLAIAGSGSFTGGADRILRSQSAVSLQMKRLEALIGQPLFVRHGRGVALSPAGERLEPAARRIVGMLDTTLAGLRLDPLEGTIHVGIPEERTEGFLPNIIARFSRSHPRVEVVVTCAPSTSFPDAIEQRRLDVAVYEVEAIRPGLHVLHQERTGWLASHALAVDAEGPLPVAFYDRDCWWRDRMVEALEQMNREYRVACTSASVAGVLSAVEAGIAVGVVGERFWRSGLRRLSEPEGFPPLPASHLVVDSRASETSSIAQAMTAAIVSAFERSPMAGSLP